MGKVGGHPAHHLDYGIIVIESEIPTNYMKASAGGGPFPNSVRLGVGQQWAPPRPTNGR